MCSPGNSGVLLEIVMTKQTVGTLASLLLTKADDKHTVNEQTEANLTDYEKEFLTCVETGKKIYHGDFFVEVQVKKEKLLENVIRNYFIHKQACPTPTWDQHVYKYVRYFDDIEYLWSVPARDICDYMIDNALSLPKEERQLLQFVMEFKDGTLDRRAAEINGETGPQATLFKKDAQA